MEAVLGEPSVDLFHPLNVESGHLGVIHHGQRVIFAHDALGGALDRFRGHPRLVDVLDREILENGLILFDKVAVGVHLAAEFDWAVAVEELVEKGRAREPPGGRNFV